MNDNNINLLVVWQNIPETCDVYLINICVAEAEALMLANDCYINCNGNRAVDCLNMAFSAGEPSTSELKYMEEVKIDNLWFGRFKDCKLGACPDLSEVTIHSIIETGFYL